MNGKQKLTLTTIALCVAITGTSVASGAPTSQFGFKGWPYRQTTSCPKVESNTNDAIGTCPTQRPCVTQRPQASCPTIAPTVEPTQAPVITQAPTEAPQPTAEPTQAPQATAQPTATPVPTAKPTPTASPVPTKAPQITQTPVVSTPSPSTDDDYTTGSISAQEEIAFNLLNADRQNNGRSALKLDPELCRLARIKSCDMNANHYFAHTSPTLGSAADLLRANGYAFTSVGENIAHHATVDKAQAAFMSSTGHRTNILGSQWTKVGVGVCYDSQGFVYVTQLFVR